MSVHGQKGMTLSFIGNPVQEKKYALLLEEVPEGIFLSSGKIIIFFIDRIKAV